MRKMSVSVIFSPLYFILTSMRSTKPTERSGKITTSLVTIGGLIFVWTIVWTNLPSKEELLLAEPASRLDEMPHPSELDLTIPGLSDQSVQRSEESRERSSVTTMGGLSVPQDRRAGQIAEVKCEAEVQQYCPDSLPGAERRRCVAQRLKRFDVSCQQILRQRLARWKEAEGYKLACAEDVKRVCRTVEPGEGRILECLQEHEQNLSESCFQSLPKGRLNLRN